MNYIQYIFTTKLLARARGVPVGWRSGGQQASPLVATKIT